MFLTGRFIIPLLFTTHLAIPFPRIRIPCGVTHHLSQGGFGMQVATNFRSGNEALYANCKAFTQELSRWLHLDLRARVA